MYIHMLTICILFCVCAKERVSLLSRSCPFSMRLNDFATNYYEQKATQRASSDILNIFSVRVYIFL